LGNYSVMCYVIISMTAGNLEVYPGTGTQEINRRQSR